MEKIIINRILAIISFGIFFIGILKYYLVNIQMIIYPYSPLNRTISWIIFPFTMIGVLISIFIIFKEMRLKKISYINILSSLPIIIYFIYFFFLKGVVMK